MPERDDVADPIPDCWFRRLRRGHQICWEDLYQRDIEFRGGAAVVAGAGRVGAGAGRAGARAGRAGAGEEHSTPVARADEDGRFNALEKKLLEGFRKLKRSHKELQESHQQLQERLKIVEESNKVLEQTVARLKSGGNPDMDYDDYVYAENAPIVEEPAEEPAEDAENAPIVEEPAEELAEEAGEDEEPAGLPAGFQVIEINEEEYEKAGEDGDAGNAPIIEEPAEEPALSTPFGTCTVIGLLTYSRDCEEEAEEDGDELDHTPLLKRLRMPSRVCLSPFQLW